MTITSFLLVIATSFPGLAFSQDADKTFYFTRPASNADMTALVTSARTMLALQDISIDQEQQALVTHGPVEKLVALDWLFHQLDPAAANRSSAPAEYKFSDDVISVIPLSPDATVADITAVTTAIRTVGDIIRLVPLITQKVLVARDTPEKIAAARWMVGQLLPHDGQAPKVDSAPYPSPIVDKTSEVAKAVIRIFRMDPKTTAGELTSTITAIRTIADLQRLFPFESGKAVIASGPPEKIAVAGWLVNELARAPDTGSIHQTTMPSIEDGTVELFYVGKPVDVAPLAAEIRTTLGLKRVFPLPHSAVILRGRADEVKMAALLVSNFAGGQ